ncbi:MULTISPECIES: hypothetical protein [Virgibacillus]|uniref:Uncharacterized protein n=1 Tax=Virgibacillus dokdonensis TaxID=302167 RepID=A0A2K9J5K0_9BACI|nr:MULTISPECIES: hypothetical protein [Virgibacillus]AUJ27015.1 hypothetical protein A21D_03981 [Virgibacillus dokdonensis]NWO14207.1 hypothetical protein [Virgibacillus sp.]
MNISQMNAITAHTLPANTNIKNTETEDHFSKDMKQTQETSSAKKDTPNIWRELSEKYDITNASFEDLNAISTALYEAGQISLREHAGFTFDFNRATESLKQQATGISPHFTMYATQANEWGNRNWIEEFQARADRAFQYGNIIGHHTNNNLTAILQKLKL